MAVRKADSPSRAPPRRDFPFGDARRARSSFGTTARTVTPGQSRRPASKSLTCLKCRSAPKYRRRIKKRFKNNRLIARSVAIEPQPEENRFAQRCQGSEKILRDWLSRVNALGQLRGSFGDPRGGQG